MAAQTSREITLSDISNVLRRQKRVLIGAPVAMLVFAILYLHISEPKYSVTLKVTPTTSATATLPSGLSGLANLTGLAIPSGNEGIEFELYLEGLNSRETSAAVAGNLELIKQLFPEDWDDAAQKWRRPSGISNRLASFAAAIFGVTGRDWRPPDAKTVNEFLDEELRIVRDRSGPIVTIVIEHERPETAQSLLAVLHEVVDTALRQKELDRTSAYVAYLREQISNVAVTEYRQALHDILAEQEKRRMVASSNLPFAAEPFGEPTISVRPTSPRPVMTIFSSTLLGLLLGLIAAMTRHQLQRRVRAGH